MSAYRFPEIDPETASEAETRRVRAKMRAPRLPKVAVDRSLKSSPAA
jgi:hypothetical protein